MKCTVFSPASVLKGSLFVEDSFYGGDHNFTVEESKQIYDALHAHFGPQTYQDAEKLIHDEHVAIMGPHE